MDLCKHLGMRFVGTLLGVTSIAMMAAFCGCSIVPPPKTENTLAPLTREESETMERLEHHVSVLAGDIGERNVFHPQKLAEAEGYLVETLRGYGYEVRRQGFEASGVQCSNIEATIVGATYPDEIVVIGAHYDAVRGSPAADDNASGAAGVLELAKQFANARLDRTVRFVLFVNEEPPFFWSDKMGSVVYAKASKKKDEHIVGMVSLETIGFYSENEHSQKYPPLLSFFLPSRGNFIAFVGMSNAKPLMKRAVNSFRSSGSYAAAGAALPWIVPRIGSSDHWSFWKEGYQAIMVTDTAPYRYKHYHKETDTPDKLDYAIMARVVTGLEEVVKDLSRHDRAKADEKENA